MKTSRVSMAWSKDGQTFWILLAMESGTEVGSKLATKYGTADASGWTLADLQAFWKNLGVWAAINSDGGAVAQLAMRQTNGSYEVVPSQQSKGVRRVISDLKQSPAGGSLLTFFVYERP
jgi:Phosphodiester glycosidase